MVTFHVYLFKAKDVTPGNVHSVPGESQCQLIGSRQVLTLQNGIN